MWRRTEHKSFPYSSEPQPCSHYTQLVGETEESRRTCEKGSEGEREETRKNEEELVGSVRNAQEEESGEDDGSSEVEEE